MSRRDQARAAAIVADYKSGMSTRKIKDKYGVGLSTIYVYASEAGAGRYGSKKGYCVACTHPRSLNDNDLCRACCDDVPLTGGRWVGRGGIQVWVQDEGDAA